jgi:hypothetical protein
VGGRHATFYLPDGESEAGHIETWTLVQNPNPSAVSVQITYVKDGADNVSFTETIPANSRRTFNMADKVTGMSGVIVTSKTAGKKIMVERAMYWENGLAGSDTIGGYSD